MLGRHHTPPIWVTPLGLPREKKTESGEVARQDPHACPISHIKSVFLIKEKNVIGLSTVP